MIKAIYKALNKESLQESLFLDEKELEQHKLDHPELYDFNIYSLEIKDVTGELLNESLLIADNKKQFLGSKIISLIKQINIQKNLSPKEIFEILKDPDLLVIERLAWTGSISLLKIAINEYQGSFYTKEDKQYLLENINKMSELNS